MSQILYKYFLVALTVVLISGCEPDSNSQSNKSDLQNKEERNPTDFLLIDSSYIPSGIISKTGLAATITSSAVHASYKNLSISMYAYDSARKMLSMQQFYVFKTVSPKQRISFVEKVTLSDDVSFVKLEVSGADTEGLD